MTPPDDDLPPEPPDEGRDIAIPAWILAGAILVLIFVVAVMFVRRIA